MLGTILNLAKSLRFWVIAGVGLLVFAFYLVGFRWRPQTQIRMKQSAALVAVENGSHRKLSELISENYADLWDFRKNDVITAFRELRQQFLTVDLQPTDARTEISGNEATVTAKISMAGSGPSPIAAAIVTEANRLNAPFVFTWKKEGAAPWSWKLVRVENADLPNLHGYRPGQYESFLEAF